MRRYPFLLIPFAAVVLMVATAFVPDAVTAQSALPRALRPDGSIPYQWLTADTATELTIATGAITVTQAAHTVDTESDAAADDLDTISGGSAGQFLILRAENAARVVTLKHLTGNISCPDATDVPIPSTGLLILVHDGTNWRLSGREQETGGEVNLASNLGAGVGVYESKSSVTLQFNSLVASSGISIAEDDPNNELDIAVSLATDPGLQFSGGDLRVLVDPSGALERVTAGLDVKASGVDSSRIADEAVTLAKMAHVATDTFLGRVTASSGDVEALDSTSLTEDGTPSAGEYCIGFSGVDIVKFDIGAFPTSGELNTASNLGAGVGVYETKSTADLQFNSLIGANGVSVSEDDVNDEIDIAVDLATDPGLEFSGGQLRALVDPSGALERVTAGLDLKDSGVDSARIADEAVTLAKLAHVATDSIVGRVTASSGDPEVLTSASVTEDATPTSGEFLLGFTGTNLRRYNIGNLPTAGGGEANTMSNLGAGVGVYETKSGIDLQLNSLVGANGVTVTEDDINDELDIAVSLATDPGLEFSGGDLRALVDPSGALERVTAGLDVKDSGVDSARIADEAVTLAKMAHVATASLLGRTTAASGDVEELTVGDFTADATPTSGEFLLGYNASGLAKYDIANLPGSGAGDVVGPASSSDNAIARYDGLTGKLLQNSTATLDDNGRVAPKWINIGTPNSTALVSGEITITSQFVTVSTTGDLDTILGGSDGDLLWLKATSGLVTLKDAAGNIIIEGGDLAVTVEMVVNLVRISGNWYVIGKY